MLPTEHGLYFDPDPINTLTKWGRRELRNKVHLLQYYISCKDGLAPLDIVLTLEVLCDALTERYGNECGDYEQLIISMLTFVYSRENFESLFHEEKGGRYLLDPSLPDVDL